MDVESGGASVPLVWHIGEVHDDARLRAAGVVLEPRFRAGRARFFAELLQLEPHITQFWPFWQSMAVVDRSSTTKVICPDARLPSLSAISGHRSLPSALSREIPD